MTTFKQFEQEAWEQKAHRYNDSWGSVTTQPIDRVLALAGAGPGVTLLDIGCGPGHLVAAAQRRGAEPAGCDLSSAMVSIARSNYPELRFKQSDAENLDFADNSFDAVIMNYLLLHVPDQHKVILEGRRVLKTGGQLVFSIWLPPPKSPGLRLMFEAVKTHADMTVIPPAQDIFMMSDQAVTAAFLITNGFSSVRFEEYPTGWRIKSGTEFFDAVQAGTRIGGLVDLQSPEIKSRIKEQILAGIGQFKNESDYFVPTPSLIVSAIKA